MSNQILLLEGSRFPSFDFHFSDSIDNRFKINSKPIFLNADDKTNQLTSEHHTIRTSESVWDASLILAKYLEKQVEQEQLDIIGKRVIEVGAGKALPSIAASILGAEQVIITDAPTVVSNIENIVKLNRIFNVEVKPLDWTDRDEYLPEVKAAWTFDYILAADVVWVEHLIEPLTETINALATTGHTVLIMAHHTRALRSDKLFFDNLVKNGWRFETIDRQQHCWEEGFVDNQVVIYKGIKY
ncbi:10970_t:CDS:2 [Paraglomus brasilianum]|uniref:10970_t:CDS:1 n=1 Tax=Paraglomus brasilianum TaxID=144538 RepID=A0A9N9CKZ9_9GLOM|nr:10970_t:CDS:2 [Paraglomus brasilianum]